MPSEKFEKLLSGQQRIVQIKNSPFKLYWLKGAVLFEENDAFLL